MFDLHIDIRIILIDTLLDRICDTTCHCISTASSGCIMERGFSFIIIKVNVFRIKHRLQFFKSDHKIHITAHTSS